MIKVTSRNGVEIRLTEERWKHIEDNHNYLKNLKQEVLKTVEEPEEILKGREGEFLAIKIYKDKHIVTIYKEVSDKDGFIITAFATSEIDRVRKRRKTLWKKK